MLDISPATCSRLSSLGGVAILCQMLSNVQSMELVENVVKALDKIAAEIPYSILEGGGLAYLSKIVDFFEYTQQKMVMKLLIIVTKALNAPSDIQNFVVPALDGIKNLVKYRDNDEKSKEIMELGTNAYINICDAISRFYEFNAANIIEFRNGFEMIAPEELIDNLFEMILVGSSSPGFTSLTTKTWQNSMASLRYLCKFSAKNCRQCMTNGILNIVQSMLSGTQMGVNMPTNVISKEVQSAQDASETAIYLLDAILPLKHLINTAGKDKDLETERFRIESDKEKIILEQGNALEILSEAVLPKVVRICEETAGLSIKFFCLQTIDKLCYLCDPAAVVKVFNPQDVAQFIYDILTSSENLFVCFGLHIIETVMQKLVKEQKSYVTSFKREGVFEQVKLLNDMEYLDKQYTQDEEKSWFFPENPYAKYFLSYAPSSVEKVTKPSVSISKLQKMTIGERKAAELSKSLIKPSQHIQSKKPLGNQLNSYIFVKSKELLSGFFDNAAFLKNSEEILVAQSISSACNKLSLQMDQLLQIGIAGTPDEWTDIFQRFANMLVSETSITNYEIRSNALANKLFFALCLLPTDYVRTMLGPQQEELKSNTGEARANMYNKQPKTELMQMVMRHDIFFSIMIKTVQGKSIFFLKKF